ncbi:reverse transcriptase domain-containing protein [Tanacetum coccineum]
MMPPRMTTRSADRGGATPRGRRTDARKGRGGSRGNADNGIIGYNGNNDGIGNVGVRWQRWSDSIYSMGGEDRIDDRHEQRVKYAAGSLTRKAVTWWNTQVQARGRTTAMGMAWDDFKTMLRDEYCPHNEMQRLENEFWNHTMRIDRYICGLVPEIHGMVRATKPFTIQSAILKAGGLTDDAVRNGLLKRSSEKRKESGETTRKEDARSKIRGLRLEKDSWRQILAIKSTRVFTLSHMAKDCRTLAKRVMPVNAINSANNPRVCYKCGSLDNFSNSCLKIIRASGQVHNNPNQALSIGGNNFNRGNHGNRAQGHAFALGANEALQDPNIMTGTLSLNDQYATVLFDSGADSSFVSTKFMALINA